MATVSERKCKMIRVELNKTELAAITVEAAMRRVAENPSYRHYKIDTSHIPTVSLDSYGCAKIDFMLVDE